MTLSESLKALSRSQRGMHALRGLELFLNEHCHSLDSTNAAAIVELVKRFTGNYPSSTLEAIRETLSGKEVEA